MKTDEQIQRDVETQLQWHSGIDASDIAVKVKGSVVLLTGYARNYYERSEAEAIAKSAVGVVAVADDIEVRIAHWRSGNQGHWDKYALPALPCRD